MLFIHSLMVYVVSSWMFCNFADVVKYVVVIAFILIWGKTML